MVPSRQGGDDGLLLSDTVQVRPAAQPGPARSGIDLTPLRAVWRHKWLLLATFLLIAVPALAGIWKVVTPKYRARATVEISPTNPRILYKTEDTGLIPMYQQYLNSQVGIIVGNTVLQRVLERTDVQGTDWYRESSWLSLGNGGSPMERLREGLLVRPRGRTFLIDIDMITKEAKDAPVIVAAVLEEYREEAKNRVRDTDLLVLGTLESTLNELEVAISGHEKLTEELGRELGTNMPDELIAQKRLRLDELESNIQQVRHELELAQWQQSQLTRTSVDLEASEAAEPAAPPTIAADDSERRFERALEADNEWWRLHLAVQEAQRELDQAGIRYGADHPTMISLGDKVERLEGQLAARAAQVRKLVEEDPVAVAGNASSVVPPEVALERRLVMLRKEHDLLAAAIQEQRANLMVDFERAQQLIDEQEELRKHKSKAEFVRTRLDEKETERGPIAMIRVVSHPLTPTNPFLDRRPLLSGLALMGALGAGIGLAFLRGMTGKTILEADQLSVCSHMPMLGALPLTKQLTLSHPLEADAELLEGEHYRILRTALLRRFDECNGQVLLVTSSSAGAGKTTVSIRLARSLARCGKRTILVDADVRAPGVARQLGISPEPGLLEVLRKQADPLDVIRPTEVAGLDVIATGRGVPADTELLANGVFSRCLTELRSRYDVILLDSPPVLPVADARILARHADGTLLVVREKHCRQQEIVNTMSFLNDAGGRMLGTVYIGERAGARYYGNRYGRYGYGYGYGYGAAEEGEAGMDARQEKS